MKKIKLLVKLVLLEIVVDILNALVTDIYLKNNKALIRTM